MEVSNVSGILDWSERATPSYSDDVFQRSLWDNSETNRDVSCVEENRDSFSDRHILSWLGEFRVNVIVNSH